jgi:hypothetical protein
VKGIPFGVEEVMEVVIGEKVAHAVHTDWLDATTNRMNAAYAYTGQGLSPMPRIRVGFTPSCRR